VAYRVCQKVQVEWGGTWWAAEILKVRGNQYYIHYTGWNCSWTNGSPTAASDPAVLAGRFTDIEPALLGRGAASA
jgi:hypothetical protein